MFTQFAMDLRLARKVAGLSQDDCATLMNRNRKFVARLEKGELGDVKRDLVSVGTNQAECVTTDEAQEFEDLPA